MPSNHTPNDPPAFNLEPLSHLERPQRPCLETSPGPWLWPQVLPYDQTTLLAGPPGVGKSFLALDIAARVSRGHSMPFCPDSPEAADVLLFAPEDSPQNTIAPRLRTLGADTSRIHLIRGMKNPRRHSSSQHESANADLAADSLADSVSALMDAATSLPDCALIIIDPLAALLAASANNASHIRTALTQLAEFARESCIPILAIAHTQPARTAGRQRILGPAVLSVLPRTIWHLQHYQGNRALTPAKSNLSSPPAFTFSLGLRGITWLECRPDLAQDPTLDLAERPVFDEARDFLLTELHPGPRPANEMLTLARKLGFSSRTVQSARESLHIKPTKVSYDSDNQWIWTLPTEGSKIARAELAA